MRETKEVSYCKSLLTTIGSKERESIINLSCLNNREKDFVRYRFIEGYTLQECSEKLNIEINSVVKAQKRILTKLYIWLN